MDGIARNGVNGDQKLILEGEFTFSHCLWFRFSNEKALPLQIEIIERREDINQRGRTSFRIINPNLTMTFSALEKQCFRAFATRIRNWKNKENSDKGTNIKITARVNKIGQKKNEIGFFGCALSPSHHGQLQSFFMHSNINSG